MKNIRCSLILLVVLLLLSACAQPAIDESVAVGESIVQVGDVEYTLSELEALGVQETDFTNRDGDVTTFSGVPVKELISDAGIDQPGKTFIITASDGYEATVTVDEVLACDDCILAFDNGSLRLVMPDFPGNLQVKDVVNINIEN